jgi:hypothetical protein
MSAAKANSVYDADLKPSSGEFIEDSAAVRASELEALGVDEKKLVRKVSV